jgi:hypothetical protein
VIENKIKNNRCGRKEDKKVKNSQSQEDKKVRNNRYDREKGKK